jgi:hypothetical protein
VFLCGYVWVWKRKLRNEMMETETLVATKGTAMFTKFSNCKMKNAKRIANPSSITMTVTKLLDENNKWYVAFRTYEAK